MLGETVKSTKHQTDALTYAYIRKEVRLYVMYVILQTGRSRITHESVCSNFQWGPCFFLLKRQHDEEIEADTRESGNQSLALSTNRPLGFFNVPGV